MATAAAAPPGLIDPTKGAKYPILLSDRLSGSSDAKVDQLLSIACE